MKHCFKRASPLALRCQRGRCILPPPPELRTQGPPKRGGILRVRGQDPPHFDPHLSGNFKTHTTLSFVYSKLVRYRVGGGVPPGTLIIDPDVAEHWEALDDTTVVFHLRHGVQWQNKPPLKGRELVAEDVKFSFDRFLTEKANRKPLSARLCGPG